jgi:RsiW-degrading membrane proteinase PrsW (M82 family)
MSEKTEKQNRRKRASNKLKAAGMGSVNAMLIIGGFFDPNLFTATSKDTDSSEIPTFVAVLMLLLGLVVAGFVVYVIAILISENWSKAF